MIISKANNFLSAAEIEHRPQGVDIKDSSHYTTVIPSGLEYMIGIEKEEDEENEGGKSSIKNKKRHLISTKGNTHGFE